jgi:hypothetical protein
MTWEAYCWVAWLFAFVVLEGIALKLAHKRGAMTLTYFVEHHAPRWLLAAFIGWLAYHFLVSPLAGM